VGTVKLTCLEGEELDGLDRQELEMFILYFVFTSQVLLRLKAKLKPSRLEIA
jgi:hypothetical protein